MQALIYTRISKESEAGLSLESQLEKCRAMATVKGWTVGQVFTDNGISGTKGVNDRPALQNMLETVKTGNFCAVIIPALDRLGRKTSLVLDLVSLVTKQAAIVSCRESLDTTNPTGQFILTVLAAVTQLERDYISERTRNALKQKKARGEQYGSIPYGFRRGEVARVTERGETRYKTTPDEHEQHVIRIVLGLRAKTYGPQKIANILNRKGIQSRSGNQWTKTQIVRILARVENVPQTPAV